MQPPVIVRAGVRHRPSMVVAVLGLSIALAGAACGGDAGDPTGRTWMLTELQGAPALEGTIVTITFADGTVSGSGGCNSFTGSATWGDGDLSVDPRLASTMMACEGPIQDQEDSVLAALPQATSYEVDGDTLRLFDDSGSVVARFTATAP